MHSYIVEPSVKAAQTDSPVHCIDEDSAPIAQRNSVARNGSRRNDRYGLSPNTGPREFLALSYLLRRQRSCRNPPTLPNQLTPISSLLRLPAMFNADMESQSSICRAMPSPPGRRILSRLPNTSAVSKTGLTIEGHVMEGNREKTQSLRRIDITNLRTTSLSSHVRSYVGAGDQEDHSAAPGRYVHAALSDHQSMEPETSRKAVEFRPCGLQRRPLHEYFPCCRFRTQDGLTVGSHRCRVSQPMEPNHTARWNAGEAAPTSIPDLNLYFLPKAADRAVQGSFIQQHLERPLSK